MEEQPTIVQIVKGEKMKKVIGITGGIASGKSNITFLLRQKGYVVIDSDAISRRLSEPDGPVYQAIIKEFGRDYLKEDLTIDRSRLGKYIFSDEVARQKLNAISHPFIVQEIKNQINQVEKGFLFLDIPLLYEAHLEYLCEKVICIYLSYDIQLKRLMARDQIDCLYAQEKIASQMSLEEKKKKADYVIDTSGTFEQTEALLDQLLLKIKGV